MSTIPLPVDDINYSSLMCAHGANRDVGFFKYETLGYFSPKGFHLGETEIRLAIARCHGYLDSIDATYLSNIDPRKCAVKFPELK